MELYIISAIIIVIICLRKESKHIKNDPNSPNKPSNQQFNPQIYVSKRTSKYNRYKKPIQSYPPFQQNDNVLPIAGHYQKKWILTTNEKIAYQALKHICDEKGLHLMSKVRLFDLVEPIRSDTKYKTYLYKIQAKHVDFVICDKNLTAQCIIELDDSSHNRIDRMERDKFVDEVLKSVGYTIIHTWGITEQTKSDILKALNITSSQQPGI